MAFALKGGIIVCRVSQGASDSQFDGPILKGTGNYQGITGTIEAHSPPHNDSKTFVTLHYNL